MFCLPTSLCKFVDLRFASFVLQNFKSKNTMYQFFFVYISTYTVRTGLRKDKTFFYHQFWKNYNCAVKKWFTPSTFYFFNKFFTACYLICTNNAVQIAYSKLHNISAKYSRNNFSDNPIFKISQRLAGLAFDFVSLFNSQFTICKIKQIYRRNLCMITYEGVSYNMDILFFKLRNFQIFNRKIGKNNCYIALDEI